MYDRYWSTAAGPHRGVHPSWLPRWPADWSCGSGSGGWWLARMTPPLWGRSVALNITFNINLQDTIIMLYFCVQLLERIINLSCAQRKSKPVFRFWSIFQYIFNVNCEANSTNIKNKIGLDYSDISTQNYIKVFFYNTLLINTTLAQLQANLVLVATLT